MKSKFVKAIRREKDAVAFYVLGALGFAPLTHPRFWILLAAREAIS